MNSDTLTALSTLSAPTPVPATGTEPLPNDCRMAGRCDHCGQTHAALLITRWPEAGIQWGHCPRCARGTFGDTRLTPAEHAEADAETAAWEKMALK